MKISTRTLSGETSAIVAPDEGESIVMPSCQIGDGRAMITINNNHCNNTLLYIMEPAIAVICGNGNGGKKITDDVRSTSNGHRRFNYYCYYHCLYPVGCLSCVVVTTTSSDREKIETLSGKTFSLSV